MASNGVILLNLENRNAAEFQRLSVPDSYEKASGALTSGTYVTVYKWLYNGFMLAPSLCDAVDETDHINLVDRTNGGVISVYPDDTITIEGVDPTDDLMELSVTIDGVYDPPAGYRGFSEVRVGPRVPTPLATAELNVNRNGTWVAPYGSPAGYSPVNVNIQPEIHDIKAYHITSGSTTSPYSLTIQEGHFRGRGFSTNFVPSEMILDGEPINLTTSMCTGVNTPYLLEGCLTIAYINGWILRSSQGAHQYMNVLSAWASFAAGILLEQWDPDASAIDVYFCSDN